MNRVDVHPEDLLDAAHRGELDEAGRQRLNKHLAHCASCRLEHTLIDDIAEETAAREGDDVRLDAAVALALGAAATTGGSRPAWGPRRVAYIAGGALLLGAFGGAAAAWWAMTPSEPEVVESPADAEDTMERETGAAEPRATDPDPLVVEEDPAVAPEIEEGPVDPQPAHAIRTLSAAELFEQANAARRDGQTRVAVRRYRELQSTYAESREARLSHVSLGRLLLDRLLDADGALRQFDRYLEEPGVLGEEARVGRAIALERLGRTAEERRAWQDLLDHHPSTPHADRARARIQP